MTNGDSLTRLGVMMIKTQALFVLVLNSSCWVYWSMKVRGEIFVVQGIYDDSDLLFNQI